MFSKSHLLLKAKQMVQALSRYWIKPTIHYRDLVPILDAAGKTNSDPELDDSGDEGSQSDDDSETKDEYDAPDAKDEENIEQQDGAEFAVALDVHFQVICCQMSLWHHVDLLRLHH